MQLRENSTHTSPHTGNRKARRRGGAASTEGKEKYIAGSEERLGEDSGGMLRVKRKFILREQRKLRRKKKHVGIEAEINIDKAGKEDTGAHRTGKDEDKDTVGVMEVIPTGAVIEKEKRKGIQGRGRIKHQMGLECWTENDCKGCHKRKIVMEEYKRS